MEHEAIKNAPSILDYLNETSTTYFEKVKSYLDAMGIEYIVDPTLVRGLDYYNHTAFEIMSEASGFGAITTLLGGGRYNGLTKELGGPDVPGVGFGMGLERLMLALENENVKLPVEDTLDIFLITIGDSVKEEAVRIVNDLRTAGLQVDKDYQERSIRAQFRAADRLQARYVLIIGEDELKENKINIRTMETGEEEAVSIENIVNVMKEKL